VTHHTADAALLVRPASFSHNPETARTNAFMPRETPAGDHLPAAQAESDALARNLAAAGVRVLTAYEPPGANTPDALFPNNWLSTHPDATAVLYPMRDPSRRRERRAEVLDLLRAHNLPIARVDDTLLPREHHDQPCEGTGSLVIDHAHRRAFAARSPRTHESTAREAARLLRLEPVIFDAPGPGATPIYHTNVLLALAPTWAIVCPDAIAPADRDRVLDALRAPDRALIHITPDQMARFTANALALRSARDDTPLCAISESGFAALTKPQRAALTDRCRPVVTPIPTIERIAGGSVRCMICELFLPPAPDTISP
jgi:hypothetical protein